MLFACRQNKLDEALVSSGRISDALASLLEWLNKAETYLAEDQPILGDLDTVNILIEQHKAFQGEVEARREMVTSMRDGEAAEGEGGVASQMEELAQVWERVTTLSNVREARLKDALKLVSFRFFFRFLFPPSLPLSLRSLFRRKSSMSRCRRCATGFRKSRPSSSSSPSPKTSCQSSS